MKNSLTVIVLLLRNFGNSAKKEQQQIELKMKLYLLSEV